LSSKASLKWSSLLTWTNIDKVVAIASLQPFDYSWMRRFDDLQHHKHMCGFNFLSTTIALKLWAHYKLVFWLIDWYENLLYQSLESFVHEETL
jgi:hypothetical protein